MLNVLLAPMVLFFLLGVIASLVRSDLSIPKEVVKFLTLFLMMSIGFKGGVEVAKTGITAAFAWTALAGVALSFLLPFTAFSFLKHTKLSRIDAAAVAGHYGSISAVTFVAALDYLSRSGIASDGFMVAIAALMESPAIFAALMLAKGGGGESKPLPLREVFANGSILMLAGAFVIGMVSGESGMAMIKPFLVDNFRGFLCIFLLEMGMVTGARLPEVRKVLSPGLVAFGVFMPLFSAFMAFTFGTLIGLPVGSLTLLMTLAASASYIAVPAALRLTLPEANLAIPLTLSLAITFPLNILIGIPAYLWVAQRLA